MVLIVSNLKGPLLVTLAYLKLIDAILVTPKRYSLPESREHPELDTLPKYFETDFHNATITPEKLAGLHTQYATEKDYVIAPDIRGEPEETLKRYYEYVGYYSGEARIIFPHQSLHIDTKFFDITYENEGIIGIPALNKQGQPRPVQAIREIIDDAKDWGLPYHLLGFNPTRGWPREFFTNAYSFDSQAILTYAKRYPSTFHVLQDGSWIEVDHRRTGIRALSLETRMIMYHDHLRDWLSMPLPPQMKLERFIENETITEVII